MKLIDSLPLLLLVCLQVVILSVKNKKIILWKLQQFMILIRFPRYSVCESFQIALA